MNKDEIIEMARQAGIIAIHTEGDGHWYQQFIVLEAFAKLVADQEREACAKVCDNKQYVHPYHDLSTLIRARGKA